MRFLAFCRNTLAIALVAQTREQIKDGFAKVPIGHGTESRMAQRFKAAPPEFLFELGCAVEAVGGNLHGSPLH